MLANIRIVLNNTSHPGNIGASARAMKNMGLTNLYLVAPKIFPDPICSARAKHAADLLDNAVVTHDLATALQGCTLVFGTSARDFNLNIANCVPRVATQLIADALQQRKQSQIAIIFGTERTGLTKQELAFCNYIINIPSSDYASLNLAQAVQLISYELYVQLSGKKVVSEEKLPELATADELVSFYQELEHTLINIKMLNPNVPRNLMQRMRELYNRASISKTELNMLRGMLTAINN